MKIINTKYLYCSLILVGLLTACSPDKGQQQTNNTANSTEKVKTIDITAIVEHPALDAIRKGTIDELKQLGFSEGKNLKINFQNAQGNTATAGQIAQQFVGENPDVIIPISTPSAQAVVASTKTIPIVFSGITDPVAAKLVKSVKEPSHTNVTGVSDTMPLDPQIDLIKEIIPNLKAIGYIYSPGEVNSTIVMHRLEEKLKPMNIELVAVPAQRTADIATVARSLKGKVDVIYTALDNNVVSAYESLFQAAKEAKIPLIAADTDSVRRGAVAALGLNYDELGHETGKIVAQILNGKKPGDITPSSVTKLDLYVSPSNAQAEGIKLPESVVEKATVVVDSNKK